MSDADPAEFDVPQSVRDALASGTPPIQAFREWRGFDPLLLSLASFVPVDRIMKHEVGRIRLSFDELAAIAVALGVPVELLMEEDPAGGSGG